MSRARSKPVSKARQVVLRRRRGLRDLSLSSWGQIEAPDVPLGQLAADAFPEDIMEQHTRCGQYADNPGNWFVREAVKLNARFANYGLTLRLKTGKGEDKAPRVGEDPWLDKAPDPDRPYRTRRRILTAFIAAAWTHRFTYSNVVSLWWQSVASLGEPFPQLILPQECTYKDAWGKEELAWSAADQNAADAPDEWTNRPDRNVLKTDSTDFSFSVFKRGAPGHGFDTPEMVSVFAPLFECESLEASEATLALAARQVIRQHQLGHEQRYGPTAGNTAGNGADRRAALKTALENKTGLVDLAGAYDHTINYVVPDVKHYDARKWVSIVERLLWWSGPLGHLSLLRGTSPYLMWTARVHHADERMTFGAWLEEVIAQCTSKEISLRWSNRCYTDPRIAAEQARFAHTSGILSQGGFAEDAGFDDAEELARKRTERTQVEDRLPVYDAAHGLVGGKPVEKPGSASKGAKGQSGDSTGGGRPAGVGDT